ncbi:c-type cytochrome [Ovoidimarina sediminis]|uniref:c-type cytochrome n=1 Tax=Ovoidimarina sediminis TaxID=3079856 RepID=UPI00290D481E|nr:c-type cytochrome [Rhodophyticola sp. MJ-SS7]MDU8946448.1 c-type cytochrome [Rhodophyticola sp. MJ-SS7]
MSIRQLLVIILASLGIAETAIAEGDPENGRDLARSNCARCHGVDGNARSTSFQPVPMLAGQPSVYLLNEMKNYVSGARVDSSKGASMTKFLRDLSDQDLADLAAFYEVQKRY